MTLIRFQLGPLTWSLTWGDDDQEAGAPDFTSQPMGPVGFTNWERPTLPALEVEA